MEMDKTRHTAPAPVARRPGMGELFASPNFGRLWTIGACANTMRWFELLAAALFTLDMTGSGFAVAVVSAARTMPMLVLGAFAGVVSEALNRKHVLFAGDVLRHWADRASRGPASE